MTWHSAVGTPLTKATGPTPCGRRQVEKARLRQAAHSTSSLPRRRTLSPAPPHSVSSAPDPLPPAVVLPCRMPSWNDGESSSPSLLGDLTDMDYAPDTCYDPSFHGIAVGCEEVCRVHRQEPQKCVAFEGTNTGRRFYMCSMKNQVENCGFQSWIDDEEWPETMQNSLTRLWSMYHEAENARLDERVQNGQIVAKLCEEKKKIEKKYFDLLDDVQKFMNETEMKVLQANYKKIVQEDQGECSQVVDNKEVETMVLKKEVEFLKNQLVELKQVHKSQADIMRARDIERNALKEEKKKLEFILLDMVKALDALKVKVKKIQGICEE